MSTEPLLAFKAGKATRREGTNFVDPGTTKGAIILQNEDGLLHFKWKNRESGEVEEDLILFPQDASFAKVTQAPGGRLYVLKFMSSNQRHFFWMQDASSARDEEFASQINRLLDDPESVLVWSGSNVASSSTASSSTAAPAASSSTTSAHPPGPASAEQIAQLSEILRNMNAAQDEQNRPTVSLRDVLTRENLLPLFTTHPELISTLFPYLPPDLPSPPSPEVLSRVISSPQFQDAVSSFDRALHTGLLGGLVRSLGLPEEAGTGVEPFLRAVQDQAAREGGSGSSSGAHDQDQMETD